MAPQHKSGTSKKQTTMTNKKSVNGTIGSSANKKRKSTLSHKTSPSTKKHKKLTNKRQEEEEDLVDTNVNACQTRKSTRRIKKVQQPLVVEHDSSSDIESSAEEPSSDDDFQTPPPPLRSKRAHVKPNSNQVESRKNGVEKDKKKQRKKPSDTNKQVKSSSDYESSTSTENNTTFSIQIPKGAPFADALSPDLLQFLVELKDDNCREFMRTNEKRWQTVRKDFMDFVKMVSEQLHEIDPTVLIEEPRNAIYRQHRDLRFTNDLRPYKAYMQASFSRGGKKSPFAGYFLRVAPNGETHVAAGIWDPSPPRIQRIREGIIENADLMREALTLPIIKETFGQDGLSVLSDQDKLKTAPKNIARDHPEIELLRYKSFVISKTFTDEDVLSAGFLDKVLDVYEALVPFITILNVWTG